MLNCTLPQLSKHLLIWSSPKGRYGQIITSSTYPAGLVEQWLVQDSTGARTDLPTDYRIADQLSLAENRKGLVYAVEIIVLIQNIIAWYSLWVSNLHYFSAVHLFSTSSGIIVHLGYKAGNTVAQLVGSPLWFTAVLLSVWRFTYSHHVYVGFIPVLRFPSTPKSHVGRYISYPKSHLDVSVCVCVCWCQVLRNALDVLVNLDHGNKQTKNLKKTLVTVISKWKL